MAADAAQHGAGAVQVDGLRIVIEDATVVTITGKLGYGDPKRRRRMQRRRG